MTAAALLFVVAATATGGAAAPAAPGVHSGGPRVRAGGSLPAQGRRAPGQAGVRGPLPFCNNPRYPLTKDEVRWCALIPKQDARCPELARACNRGATAEIVGHRARPQQSSTTIRFPSAPAPVRILLWILLAVGVRFSDLPDRPAGAGATPARQGRRRDRGRDRRAR